jgi:hypothetical protein
MDYLCGYHARNADTCKWVLENTDPDTDNITVQLWRQACKEFLEQIDNTQK